MKRVAFFLCGCLLVSALSAQSLTGIWRGYFYSGVGMFRQQYKYEVQFDQLRNKALHGVTYSYNTTSFYGKAGLRGIFQNAANSVIMKEDTLLEVRGNAGQTCLMTCYLDYSKDGKTEILQGSFTSVVTNTGSDCGSGTVYLERVENSDFTKEDFLLKKPSESKNSAKPKAQSPTPPPVAKTVTLHRRDTAVVFKKKRDTTLLRPLNDTLAKKLTVPPAPIPPVVKERKNDLVRTIITNSPEIKIDLYDNGEIDGDTITVYHNNEVMAYKRGLSDKAITLHVTATAENNIHEFIMFADNLGKIPPNTALMVITTGGKRYELSLVSTKEKNAKVIVEYQPQKS